LKDKEARGRRRGQIRLVESFLAELTAEESKSKSAAQAKEALGQGIPVLRGHEGGRVKQGHCHERQREGER